MLPNFEYIRPHSLHEVIRQLQAKNAAVFAGGTELLGALRDGISHADRLISISGVHELKGISLEETGVRIGSLATLSEVASHPDLIRSYAVLAQGAAAAASPQLRNQGTIGGNLCQKPRCWYFRAGFKCLRADGEQCFAVDGENEFHSIFGGRRCFIVHPSDTAPALLALNAELRIVGPKGSRRVPISKFFLLPDESLTHENRLSPSEVIAEILIPRGSPKQRSSYRKVRARGSWDFALAGVALAVTTNADAIADVRIVLSGVAPIPWRATGAEDALIGQKFTPQLAARAAEASTIGASPLSQNGYKVDLVRGIVEESLVSMFA